LESKETSREIELWVGVKSYRMKFAGGALISVDDCAPAVTKPARIFAWNYRTGEVQHKKNERSE
jgi:hypothetical protein